MMNEHPNAFDFHWKYKDFEIRSTPYFSTGLPYVELVKWDTDGRRPYCYTLASYRWDEEGGELHFVGDRPFRDIADIDLTPIWKQLWLACDMLKDWYEKEELA